MANLNEVRIEGNLCKDTETKSTKNGKCIGNNSIAYNESYKKGDEFVKVSHYFELTAFGAVAERLAQFKRGDAVHIEGMLKQDRWDDVETGKKRSKVYIVVWKIESLARPESKPQGTPSTPHKDPQDGFVDDTLDPPF